MKPKIFRPAPATRKVADIKPGNIIHKQLSSELEERIRKLESIFAEVFKRTHEEWLDSFRRDLNPESQIRLWEAMASAYQTFLGKHALSLPAKKEALGLLCSGQNSSSARLRYLSREEADEVMRLFSSALAQSQKPFQPN
ncbi:MAG TPA: hypothetical protein VNZ64_24985 [Candidatus Acidoferrum sp.]|jgi:hypothetical protein|nr:hypothetical protein [Candidatus Acidoferrum sp.]